MQCLKYFFGHTTLSGLPEIQPYSRGATALLIKRASGKGLIVDSTSANGPLLGIPFLASTGWSEKYLFTFFHFS